MITPAVIANNFIIRAAKEHKDITPLKLQKLIYFLYKEYLQKTGNELFTERFETWKYGPVVPSIYYEFASYGKKNITSFARDSRNNVVLVRETEPFKSILDTVWTRYKDFSGEDLSNKTHADGSAWKKACERKSQFLDIEDIRNEITL